MTAPQPFVMTLHDIIDELFQKCPFSSDRPECERFDSSCRPLACLLAAREPYLEWSAAVPKPVHAWSRNQRDALVPHGCVQVHATDLLKEFLFQKPFLHPYKCGIVVLDSDHHGGLFDDPVPDVLWNSPQINTQSTDDHEQQSARGELVLPGEHIF